MITQLIASLRAIVVLTVLTCVVYPIGVTALGQALFPKQANGSLVRIGQSLIGSELIAQKFTGDRYFWPRPSAADYATVASGASNQGFLSKKLETAVTGRRAAHGGSAPPDLLYASGSGLDPHLSPEAARFQVARVAAARGLDIQAVMALVERNIQSPQFGFLGQARVNVLMLNIQLDELDSGSE